MERWDEVIGRGVLGEIEVQLLDGRSPDTLCKLGDPERFSRTRWSENSNAEGTVRPGVLQVLDHEVADALVTLDLVPVHRGEIPKRTDRHPGKERVLPVDNNIPGDLFHLCLGKGFQNSPAFPVW